MLQVGDTVYIRSSVTVLHRDGQTTTVPFTKSALTNKPARLTLIDGTIATITLEEDGTEQTLNVEWLARWVDFANVDQVEQYLEDDRICGNRGPRMGNEGVMICKRPLNHEGRHKPAPDDGWGDQSW